MKMFQRQAATNSIGMLFGGRLILKRCTSVGAVMPNHALAHIIAMIKFDFSLPSAWAEFLGKIWRDGHSLLPASKCIACWVGSADTNHSALPGVP